MKKGLLLGLSLALLLTVTACGGPKQTEKEHNATSSETGLGNSGAVSTPERPDTAQESGSETQGEENSGQTGQETTLSSQVSPSGKPYSYYDTVEPTYINGVLLVNKTYALPRDYGGYDETATAALNQLQAGAEAAGYSMPLLSGYRAFDFQDKLYRKYVAQDGVAAADTYSAWPGHSEHQTGLAFDIGSITDDYGDTAAGKWLAAHAHEYGFIIRYPLGKESITGYQYEPWHVRYLGIELATDVYESGLCLEEYLTSGRTPEPETAPETEPEQPQSPMTETNPPVEQPAAESETVTQPGVEVQLEGTTEPAVQAEAPTESQTVLELAPEPEPESSAVPETEQTPDASAQGDAGEETVV